MGIFAARARAVADTEREVVTVRDGDGPAEIRWADIGEGTLCRLPSLVDEIGLGIDAGGRTLWLRETDPGFWALFGALDLGRELPDDWYARAEEGERFLVRPMRDTDG